MALSVLGFVFALILARKMRGGALQNTWVWLSVASGFHAMIQTYAFIGFLQPIDIAYFINVVEFGMVTSFFVAFFLGWRGLRST